MTEEQNKQQEQKEQIEEKIVETPNEKKKETSQKEEKKQETKKQPVKIKKTEAVVNSFGLPISTKKSVAICNFIKGKLIRQAISDLERVEKMKRAVPMKGEIPHRKGKGMMSGRWPIKTAGFFIKTLKTLQGNANSNGLEEPIIIEAIPNKASRPYGRFGRVQRKRTHLKIIAIEKASFKKSKKSKQVKNKEKK